MNSFFILIISVICSAAIKLELDETYKWKEIAFAWPSEWVKKEAINAGTYIERNNLMLGVEIWRDKLFITVPR